MQCWNVLLVDDDEAVLQLQGAYFECMGHQVVMHASPHEASAYLRQEKSSIDLLVTDFMMPGMNGLELVALARAAGFAGPALMISGYQDQTHASELDRLGMGILAKPVRYYELVAYIKELQEKQPLSRTIRTDGA